MLLLALNLATGQERMISEDRELKELDLSGWDCKDAPGGSAKTDDGVERNKGKNRPPVSLTGLKIEQLETAGFLRELSAFDAQTKGKRRKDLNAAQTAQLKELEQKVVSLTGYLVLMYAGPPESTNCGSVDFHDWHLEVFDKPLDHPPGPGDPTPIICEITPRTQSAIFRDGARLQTLAGFFRHPDMEVEKLAQKPQRVRVTGFLLWDDEHNGSADVGTTVQKIVGRYKFHQPWRSTAWEIHPLVQLEATESGAFPPSPLGPAATPAAGGVEQSPTAAPTVAALSATAAATSPEVTLVKPVKVKIRYGTIRQRANAPQPNGSTASPNPSFPMTARSMGTRGESAPTGDSLSAEVMP